ncbi:MAG: mechanosensitive ion channel family protein [Thermoanaerobaculales bacterium]|jgi:small-conductance mechanosensitive channel|nr:mechanosensitive ion channel family protein [Thermoanaerobaculales bacterium]
MNTEALLAQIPYLPQEPLERALVIFAVALAVAFVARFAFRSLVHRMTRSTDTDVDDKVAAILRGPVFWTFVFGGVWLAEIPLDLPEALDRAIKGVMLTLIILMWSLALLRSSKVVLEALGRNVDRFRWIQPKTVPLLDMVFKFFVAGAGIYFICVAWGIPLTSWLASAGIVGIAVGFAAKDTLANLFSGVFILADSPYKVGDYVILDGGLRGEVREIGIRSTRILTRDDVEVTVPNAVIAMGRIVNETGGPWDKMRVRVKVSAAYGSDVDQVRDVLLCSVEGARHVTREPAPRVRFRAFGDSGLDFELLAWIEAPLYRGRVLDDLNRKVYKAFNDAGIEIPYPKQDVYVKELPAPGGDR